MRKHGDDPRRPEQIRFAELEFEGSADRWAIPSREEKLAAEAEEAVRQARRLEEEQLNKESPDHEREQGLSIHSAILSVPDQGVSAASVYRPPVRRMFSDLEMTIETAELRFVRYGREQEWRVEPVCSPAAFHCYWPTYENMSADQQRWYFYWRSEVRQQRYPDTDLSYLFLYVYELINGIGWTRAEEGLWLLTDIWEAYHEPYPKLDRYLSLWIQDYIWANKLQGVLDDQLRKRLGSGQGEWRELELYRQLDAVPMELGLKDWLALSDYDVKKSGLYSNEEHAGELNRLIPKVFELVAQYLARKDGKSLAERFTPPSQTTVRRQLFRNAVYEPSIYGRHVTAAYYSMSTYKPLRMYVTQLIRLTENKLRTLLSYKSKLRGIHVSSEIRDLVERFIEQETARAAVQRRQEQVTISPDKLQRLQQESDTVRNWLTVDEPSWAEQAGDKVLDSDDPAGDVPEIPLDKDTQLDLSPMELSLMKMGEPSMREEQDSIVRDAVPADKLELKQSGFRQKESGLDTQLNHADWTLAGTEWMGLADLLKPVHIEVLRSYLDGQTADTMMELASTHGSMPALLIDEINDAAMDTMGDLLILDDQLNEDYMHLLMKVLR
ncbi:TerB N-terminal domain-containing protein [Paenibacillus sp. JX-17]|uniref:TerB N-terminal domain-containing protein n=1 Tax=Paenibacillus lacisoli TaxID=3064525 RepID=A0ABT9C8S6_9BACL|nr:TerB N-terminal domain-containing protein [Paenibacillus sp. JX-17]MDO7905657.1 TerB N-terminal domain-containing protein [Paenibacillus sp. JX-17]